ncbi:unnamed protein product [Rotaria magnacalcarata]|uniref:Uncharacterized protein n=2 Tax=Rotaria magnacalcarata TaxID=392030 RepID=A0A816RVY6_9BILA|nr:unnamed protein product [Rotaria magnacalcarata]
MKSNSMIESDSITTVRSSDVQTNRTITSAILLQAQKETHRHLQSFTGDLTQDADEYIERIENIGSLTNEPGEVLHILLKEKLSGQAERWYKDNQNSLNT